MGLHAYMYTYMHTQKALHTHIPSTRMTVINRTRAVINRTRAVINRTRAVIIRTRAVIIRTRAVIIRTRAVAALVYIRDCAGLHTCIHTCAHIHISTKLHTRTLPTTVHCNSGQGCRNTCLHTRGREEPLQMNSASCMYACHQNWCRDWNFDHLFDCLFDWCHHFGASASTSPHAHVPRHSSN
jgi:hypothetical protein